MKIKKRNRPTRMRIVFVWLTSQTVRRQHNTQSYITVSLSVNPQVCATIAMRAIPNLHDAEIYKFLSECNRRATL
jgi:hypothetical protein